MLERNTSLQKSPVRHQTPTRIPYNHSFQYRHLHHAQHSNMHTEVDEAKRNFGSLLTTISAHAYEHNLLRIALTPANPHHPECLKCTVQIPNCPARGQHCTLPNQNPRCLLNFVQFAVPGEGRRKGVGKVPAQWLAGGKRSALRRRDLVKHAKPSSILSPSQKTKQNTGGPWNLHTCS